MNILEDITLGDAHRIWAARGAIRLLRFRAELQHLASQIEQIRQKTAGIELGGVVRANSNHLAFALRKLEFVREYHPPSRGNPRWESEAARLSWTQIICAKGCGWAINSLECPSCKATIQGKFLKGNKWSAKSLPKLIAAIVIMVALTYLLCVLMQSLKQW